MVMHYRPDEPMHNRYAVDHDFLSPGVGQEAVTIAQTVNAFFRWEFNSCEMLVQHDSVLPIDYANACPDVAVTSLHYYFPWAITALVRWSAYCLVTRRRQRIDLQTERYFAIADDTLMSYDEKLRGYLEIADEHFETAAYWDWCDDFLPGLEDRVLEWVSGPEFDTLVRETVAATYPEHERATFLSHFRGLTGMWVTDHGGTPYAF
jgi:hypothetical protein